MNNKTLEKLEALCAPHGVTIEAHVDSWGCWNVVFFAPPRMCWGSSQASSVAWNGSLRGIISYLKSELSCGFYDADYETLRITSQLCEETYLLDDPDRFGKDEDGNTIKLANVGEIK